MTSAHYFEEDITNLNRNSPYAEDFVQPNNFSDDESMNNAL